MRKGGREGEREGDRRGRCFLTHTNTQSMGLCFIGKRHFPRFLSEVCSCTGIHDYHFTNNMWCMCRYVEDRPGKFVTLDGEELGWHRGE